MIDLPYMLKSPTAAVSKWYYPFAVAIIFVVGSVATVATYKYVTVSVRSSLLENANAIAYAIDTAPLQSFVGSAADLENPAYKDLKERLKKVRLTDPDIRFIYFTGYRDGNPFFYLDSEPANSEDNSPPGEIYDEGSWAFRHPILNNDSTPLVDDIYTDRWGSWLTAITPIVDSASGNVVALMGMDMDARTYYRSVALYTSFPVGVTVLIITLLLVGYVIRKRERHILDFKSELVSIASHEIRIPLSSIDWIAENLLKDQHLPIGVKNDVGLIHSQSQHLLLTVNDFLDLTTIEDNTRESISKEYVNIRHLIEAIESSTQRTLQQKNLKFAYDTSLGEDNFILGDGARLKRVFAKLIANAIQFSKSDSTITVGYTQNENNTIISIKDEAIAVPHKDIENMFKGYYKPASVKGDTTLTSGLGLRYVQQIITLHGGRTWVESQENEGITFFVQLPSRLS